MRQLVLVLCALFALTASPARGQFTFMGTVINQFLVDNGAVPYSKPVLQSEIGYKFGSGFSLKAWVSRGLEGGRETDGTAEYEIGCLTSSIGYFRHAGGGSDDIVQSAAKFGCTKETGRHKTKPYLGIDRVYVRGKPGDYSGWFWRAGFQDELKRTDDRSIVQEYWVLHDSGIFQGQRGYLLGASLAAAKQYGGYKVARLVRLSLPLGATRRDRDFQLVGSLKITN